MLPSSLPLILCAMLAGTALHAQIFHDLSSGALTEDWSNTSAIATTDDWSGVASIRGYRGDALTGSVGTDPQLIVGVGTELLDVNANGTNPSGSSTGGVTEFAALADPVVAFQGSATADAPNLVFFLNTLGVSNISVSYDLRDLDGSVDNSIQPVALQYRVGAEGSFINVPAGFVADASAGPDLAVLVTPVSVMLPAAVNNQAQVYVRVITANALGNDEWIGVDNLKIETLAVVPEPHEWAAVAGAGLMVFAVWRRR